jgi:ribose 1,5-bisphosphokinase
MTGGRIANVDAGPIGPGRLVVVVGPSGAGKDTLIAAARARLAGNAAFVFPLRLVTRTATAAEDHLTISDGDFARGISRGEFAFWWEAHGLKYALPAALDDDLRAGRTVVCNVSRGIIPRLRLRYRQLSVVLVKAPAEVLAARLAGRGRTSDGNLAQRLGRAAPSEAAFSPDHTIENVGAIAEAAGHLLAVITDAHPAPTPPVAADSL